MSLARQPPWGLVMCWVIRLFEHIQTTSSWDIQTPALMTFRLDRYTLNRTTILSQSTHRSIRFSTNPVAGCSRPMNSRRFSPEPITGRNKIDWCARPNVPERARTMATSTRHNSKRRCYLVLCFIFNTRPCVDLRPRLLFSMSTSVWKPLLYTKKKKQLLVKQDSKVKNPLKTLL